MKKYTMTYADGITPVGAWQAMNVNMDNDGPTFLGSDVIEVDTLRDAIAQFRITAYATDRDVPTEEGGPWADVFFTEELRNTTDSWPVWRLTLGPRLGIRTERV